MTGIITREQENAEMTKITKTYCHNYKFNKSHHFSILVKIVVGVYLWSYMIIFSAQRGRLYKSDVLTLSSAKCEHESSPIFRCTAFNVSIMRLQISAVCGYVLYFCRHLKRTKYH